jgi:hypothetical protein
MQPTITAEEGIKNFEIIQRAHEFLKARRPSSMYIMGRQDWPEKDRFQLQFHKSTHIIRGLFLGNGAGKTTVVGIEADYWLQHKHPYQEEQQVPKWPIQILWVCQSFQQMGELRKQLEADCLTSGHRYNETKHQYTWPNGGTLTIFSTDSDWENIQGIPIDLCVVDEECDPKHWTELTMRRRGKKKTRYIIAATATQGRRWMYHDIYVPWLEKHADAGLTEDEAMRQQLHPTIWCWAKGGLEDNPLSEHDTDGIKWYEASLVRVNPNMRKVRLKGGFASFNASPVFDIVAVERQQVQHKDVKGMVGRLVPKSKNDEPGARKPVSSTAGVEILNPFKMEYEFFPDNQRTFDGEIIIFERPDPDDQFSIGADFGAGLENRDWDAAVVISQKKKRQVARAMGRWGDVNFAWVLFALGWFYNEALIVGERQYGLPIMRRLYDEWGYVRQYMAAEDESKTGVRKSDLLGHARYHGDLIIPRMEWALSPLLMDDKGHPLPERGTSVIQFVDPILLEQLHEYEWKPRSNKTDMADASLTNMIMGAPTGKFDDLVMAAAYAVTGWIELPRFRPRSILIKPGSIGEKLGHKEVREEDRKDETDSRKLYRMRRRKENPKPQLKFL